jgi:hypothetical protein
MVLRRPVELAPLTGMWLSAHHKETSLEFEKEVKQQATDAQNAEH